MKQNGRKSFNNSTIIQTFYRLLENILLMENTKYNTSTILVNVSGEESGKLQIDNQSNATISYSSPDKKLSFKALVFSSEDVKKLSSIEKD